MLANIPIYLWLSRLLQLLLNFALLALAIILIAFLIKETLVLFDALFLNHQTKSGYVLAESIVIYFLYFEFIALIVKYFQTNNHFPLRYLIYIGITAIVRMIIVEHEQPTSVLLYSAAILILIIALYLAYTDRLKAE